MYQITRFKYILFQITWYFTILRNTYYVYIWEKYWKMIFFSFGKIMKKIIMVNVGFGETLGWNNIINSMTTIFVSQQMKWFNVKGNGVLPWKPRFIPCQHHMVMVYVDHMLIHYEKSSPWKLHCFTTKDSYKTTMQLYYNYHLEIRWFLFLKSFSNIIWVLL